MKGMRQRRVWCLSQSFWLGKDYPWMRRSYQMPMVTFWPAGLFGDALTHVTREHSPDAHNCWIWKSLLSAGGNLLINQRRAFWCSSSSACPNISAPIALLWPNPRNPACPCSQYGESWGAYNVGRSTFSKKPITSLCWSCKLYIDVLYNYSVMTMNIQRKAGCLSELRQCIAMTPCPMSGSTSSASPTQPLQNTFRFSIYYTFRNFMSFFCKLAGLNRD